MGELEVLEKDWKHWHFHNTTLLVLSLILFFFLANTGFVKDTIGSIGNLGYFGAFVAGIFFVSIFTLAPASVVLFNLATQLNPLEVAVVAGFGAVFGDYLIVKYIKNNVLEELKPLFMHHGAVPLIKLFKSPHFAWIIPILGAIIIASPLTDELGLGLIGLTKIKTWQFLVITFLLNTTGIFLITIASRSF